MNKLDRKILFCILTFTAFFLSAQTSYKVSNYTSRQGLSNSSVYDIIKDSSGYLWIATELGLNKYDGQKFYQYTSSSHQLPDNMIVNVLEYKKNKFFCISGTSGYFIFDADKDTVRQLSINYSSFVFKSNKLKSKGNKIYILPRSAGFILLFDIAKDRITDTFKIKNDFIWDFDLLDDGSIVTATNNGLFKVENKKFIPFHIKGCSDSLLTGIVAISNQKGHYFFAKGGKIYIYQKRRSKITDTVRFRNEDVIVNKMFFGKQNHLWFTTHFPAGVYGFDMDSKQLVNLTEQLHGLENTIATFAEDDEANIWVGTYSSGLYKISPSVFKTYGMLENENVNYVKAIDGTRFFAATKDGLYLFNGRDGSRKRISIDTTKNCTIYDVIFFGKKTLVINDKYNKFFITKTKEKYQFITARSACLMRDSSLLVGAWSNKLELYNVRGDSIKQIKFTYLKRSSSALNRINCFLRDKKNNIWCGTDLGLFKLSEDLIECDQIMDKPLLGAIRDIVETRDGLFIGAQSGLVRYKDGKAELIQEINNHPIDKINSICVNNQGVLFIGTLNGLFRLKTNGPQAYLDEDDGLISKEINKVSYNPTANTIIIATNDGLCELNLYQYKYLERTIPKIHLDKVSSTGDIELKDEVYNITSTNLNVYFGTIGFRHASSTIYKWMLDNGEANFIRNPSVELAALPYGMHHIEIYASTDGKKWSKPLTLMVNVLTPFYRTTWFILFSVLFVLALVASIFAWRIRAIRREEKKKSDIEQKLVALKNEALNASINPHFIFNALNSVQHYINMSRNDEASDYLAKFAALIRQTLENATESVISISDEVERLDIYMELEQDRFNKLFEYTIKVDPLINKYKTKIPNMILQPLIENAILHGFKQINYVGHIDLEFSKIDDNLYITIDDNGSGILPKTEERAIDKHKRKSIGMENVIERIRTIKGASMKITNKADFGGEETGVLIELRLPFDLGA